MLDPGILFSAPTNFDPQLIEAFRRCPVGEVYGKLPADVIGGGRLSQVPPPVSFADLLRHAGLCKKNGIHFNYLLNAATSDNLEYTRRGQRGLTRLVDRLWGAGIRRFTVATPYLLRFLKSRYPHAWVKVSVFAQVGDARKARQWEAMGADEIVLDSLLVNREFKVLEKIRRAAKILLQLLVNNNCYYGCSRSPYHMGVLASGFPGGSQTRGFMPDYCFLRCTARKLREPARYLMADWIRPEDLRPYEELGYRSFKLAGRNLPTEVLIRRVKAYQDRRYDGNLLDLVQDFGHSPTRARRSKVWRNRIGSLLIWLRYSAPRRLSSWRRLWNVSRKRGFFSPPQLDAPISVDNRSLDGFLEPIIRMGGCRNRLCDECGYCTAVARKAVLVREPSISLILEDQEPLLKEMESGRFWR